MLSMDALRWLTVKALRGRTWAGMRVYDSPSSPSDLRMEDERAPFIAVYVDDAEVTLNQSISTAEITANLVIEVAVASTITVQPPSGDADTSDTDVDQAPGPQQMTQLAETDEGLEMLIGFITTQAEQALIAGNNPWAELWRVLTSPGREGGDIRRGGANAQGEPPAVRFASRLTKWRLKLLDDPVWGGEMQGFWKNFVEACEADTEMQTIGNMVRAHIEKPGDPVPDWEVEQAKGTWTLEGVMGTGITPHWWPISGEQPPAGDVGTVKQEEPAYQTVTTAIEGGEDARYPWEGLGNWQYHVEAVSYEVGSPEIGAPALTEN